MTSQSTIRKPQHAEGPTVRDVVEYQHALVNEVWCRKILRQVLQSLEAQYAAHLPHRAITPDTIVFQDNGEPLLLASPYLAAEPGLAADLRALAAVIHYAITLELAPAAPLRGRRLDGYSDSLLGAVDKCLSADLRQRPQTIDELRKLLGIVSMGALLPSAPRKAAAARAEASTAPHAGPAAQASAAPHAGSAAAPSSPRAVAPPRRLQRWFLIGLAVLVLLAAAMALVALLRGMASRDAVVLSLPPATRTAPGLDPAVAPARPAPTVAAQPGAPAAASQPGVPETAAPGPAPAPYDPDLAAARAAMEARAAAGAAPAQPAPATRAPEVRAAPATRAAPAATALITFKLQIKPWATIYVDGDERGVSPPLKRLALPPGQHTVRLVNPSFPDRIIRIEAGSSRPGTIAHDFSARRGPRR